MGVGAANPFPSGPPNPLPHSTCDGGEFLRLRYESGLYFVNPHIHTPYTYQYNLSLQREVTRNMVAEINYVGSSAKGLTALQDVNPFDLSTISGANPSAF